MRFVAVDWSGAKNTSAQRRAIWMAEVIDGEFRRIRPGFTRASIVDELVELREQDPRVIVGLDFGFSFPRRALQVLGENEAPAVWQLASEQAEDWMDGSSIRDYPLRDLMMSDEVLRETEDELRADGFAPRSTIDLRARTGNVGRQSVRGFPALRALRNAGFSIWPFDEPEGEVALEIYPRSLRRYLTERDEPKPDRKATCRALQADPRVPFWTSELARGDDNAFDAIVSVLVLSRYYLQKELYALGDPYAQEGKIWLPDIRAT